MDFSLSNSLVSTAVSNPDKLSLNLQFATDKSLTARKGPTPTFTRASTATFVGSNGLIQSAAVNAARFDHDPITLACKGLLIEESRTNLLLQSQTFGTTWTAQQLNTTGSPAYLNVATAPDGNTTADKLIATALLSTHQFRQSVTLVSGTVYSVTCYFKAAEQQFASIAAFGVANGSADWVSLFNISSSPATGTFNGFTSTSVTNAGNGWIRCTAVFTATASGSLEIRLGGASGTSGITPQIYLGDGTSGILIWGAQVEVGAFPTSYIPTTTASVVRSVDVCSITGAAFTGFWNRFAGTAIVNVGSTLGSSPAAISNTTSARTVEIYVQSSFADFFEASGVQVVRIVNGITYPTKIGLAYAINDYQSSVAGVLGGSDTNTGGTIPDATQLHIGNLGGTSNRLTGHIQSIRYFKKRLSNAKLQSLTT